MRIAFYKASGHWIDFLINLRGGGVYSHVEIVFSDGMSFSSSQWDGGIRFKKIDYHSSSWDFLDLHVSEKKEEKIREFCVQHKKRFYHGVLGFFACFLGFNKKLRSSLCAGICVQALQKGSILKDVQDYQVCPKYLYELLMEEKAVDNRQWMKMRFYQKQERERSSWINFFASFAGMMVLLIMFSYFIQIELIQANLMVR